MSAPRQELHSKMYVNTPRRQRVKGVITLLPMTTNSLIRVKNEGRGSNSGRNRDFPIPHLVQTGSEESPASDKT